MFLNIFKHLLPNALAWVLTSDKKLRHFFEGLGNFSSDIKSYFDKIWLDQFPQTTRALSEYEQQFGLRSTDINEAERRTRLSAKWQETGGQSPSYIQNILQSNGFNVYIHEWWLPGSEPALGIHAAAVPRNPHIYLENNSVLLPFISQDGNINMQDGGGLSFDGNISDNIKGYALVNIIYDNILDILASCGESAAQCGESDMECLNFINFIEIREEYDIPVDSQYWPYFLYIGGSVFGDTANVPKERENEFEELCLKLCPTQQWLGMLVNYI